MRQARKRALSRRKPHQIGFGITLSVFLSLMGLMLFERIILVTTLVGLGYNPANDMAIFVYGPDGAMGPFDWMIVALVGLCFAQGFRAIQVWQLKESNWSGFVLGACNMGMIAMFTGILIINWAFYNPRNAGARHINGLSNFVWSDFQPHVSIVERPRAPGWEQLDAQTFCHAGAGIIERTETIKPSFPIAHQRANYLARNHGDDTHFYDATITAKHYYDLDWNLITIDAPPNWPTVRAKLEAAGKEPYDLDDEVWIYLESLRHDAQATPLPSCADRVSRPFPAPTYPPPQE